MRIRYRCSDILATRKLLRKFRNRIQKRLFLSHLDLFDDLLDKGLLPRQIGILLRVDLRNIDGSGIAVEHTVGHGILRAEIGHLQFFRTAAHMPDSRRDLRLADTLCHLTDLIHGSR